MSTSLPVRLTRDLCRQIDGKESIGIEDIRLFSTLFKILAIDLEKISENTMDFEILDAVLGFYSAVGDAENSMRIFRRCVATANSNGVLIFRSSSQLYNLVQNVKSEVIINNIREDFKEIISQKFGNKYLNGLIAKLSDRGYSLLAR